MCLTLYGYVFVFEYVQMYLGYECLGRCVTVYAENVFNSASAGPKPGSKRRRVVCGVTNPTARKTLMLCALYI